LRAYGKWGVNMPPAVLGRRIAGVFPALLRALRRLNAYALACCTVAIALAAGLGLPPETVGSTIALLLLVPVWSTAALSGLRPGLTAAVLAALVYDFLFLPPPYTFIINGWQNILSFFIFCGAAAGISLIAARFRFEARQARRREMLAGRLARFSRRLAVAPDHQVIANCAASYLGAMLDANVIVLLPEGAQLRAAASYPSGGQLNERENAAAVWCWRHGVAAGRDTPVLPGAGRLFVPMMAAGGAAGVICLSAKRKRRRVPSALEPVYAAGRSKRNLIELVAGQTAAALERVRLAKDMEEARVAAAAERLRSALLTSISHDLRTPLASILGSASSLKTCGSLLDSEAREALLDMIQSEAERLNRHIANLLDMTRLEAAAVQPRSECMDLADVAGSALRRAGRLLGMHTVVMEIPADLPLVQIDPVLMEQVLFNLLDNAAKYTPAGSQVTLRAFAYNGSVVVQVADQGAGIPAGDLEHLFEKFYRGQTGLAHPSGTGLGLAICRGFVDVMGGAITAANAPGGGAMFNITLPVARGVWPAREYDTVADGGEPV
jgi:two-component system sensor histidine kinase KdpD